MTDTDADDQPNGEAQPESDVEQPETPDPMQDRETWEALDAEEQDKILNEGLERLKDSDEGHWRHLSESAKQRTREAIERGQQARTAAAAGEELSAAEKAMQEALSTTWTATLFEDDDDRPDIPFECRELEQIEQDIVEDGFRMLVAIQEEAEKRTDEGEDDLDIDDIEHDSRFFDSVDDFEQWLFAFLADVTTEAEFDEERWKTGAGLIAGTRAELLGEIFLRYQDAEDDARSFREDGRR